MVHWELTETLATRAGDVAAGRAGRGPDLVLAHGWPWSSYSWRHAIPKLATRFRVHWYDMPGYGRSQTAADQPTALDVQGEVFAEMLAHWGLRGPCVVAHDFGGAVTLRAHLLHGCDYARYVLMNVVAIRPWGSEFFTHVRRHGAAFQGLPSHIHRAIVEAYVRSALARPLPEADVENLVAPWLSDRGAPSFWRQIAQADERYSDDVEPLLGAIRSPVHIIWGEDDPWIPLERGRELHRRVAGSTLEALQGVGHMPQLEAPETLAPRLLTALDDAQATPDQSR